MLIKSRILFFLIILCPFTSKAQFNVNQYGNVGIGINVPLLSGTRLSVGTAMPGYGACFLSGATLRILNNGVIETRNGFTAPVGAIVEISHGKIL